MSTLSSLETPPRILIVEDEGLIAEELRERLSRAGMTVVATVDSADLAVEAAGRMQPDVVLMDIRIKGAKDGVEAAAEIHENVDVPVVYLTAHSDPLTLERAKTTQPFGYVLKPFPERELLIAIDMAIYRHSLERQLRESERKYVATLASIGDAVIATDLGNRVMFMNPVAEALTGYAIVDARGLPIEQVFRVVRDQDRTPINPIAEARTAGKTVRFDREPIILISRNNEAIPIDDCAAPIVNDRGTQTGAVVAFRDIRDRHLAEDALRHAREELFQSQKMESIGRLAAGIAHDFNNLLTVINGCGELALSDQGLSPTARELVTDMLKAGARAAAITRQFLAFGRRQVLRPRAVDLNALVNELTAMLRRLISGQIALRVVPSSPPVVVDADPSQIEQVIVNLVINARDAMPSGGTLTIAIDRITLEGGAADEGGSAPGEYATLTVSDTGTGIEAMVKSQIFEPFFTTKKLGEGTGLGLATVYGIVKQSGGFIRVHSEPNLGATFEVCLPIMQQPAGSTVAAVSDSATPTHGLETILVIEDEDPVRSLVVAILRRKGYTVLEASNGEEAIGKLREHPAPVHLIVTDVIMTDIQGPALVARLRELGFQIPALYVSGYTNDAVGLGDAPFLQKPFTPSVLLDKIRQILDAGRST